MAQTVAPDQISPAAGLALGGLRLRGCPLALARAGVGRVELAALGVGHPLLRAAPVLLRLARAGARGAGAARAPGARGPGAPPAGAPGGGRRARGRVGDRGVLFVRGHVLRHEVAVREALAAHHAQVGLVLVQVGHHVRHVIAVRRRALAAHPARVLHEAGIPRRPVGPRHGHRDMAVRGGDGRRARVWGRRHDPVRPASPRALHDRLKFVTAW